MNSIYVSKFGGTSLGSAERLEKISNVIQSMRSSLSEEQVIVVSALSECKKDDGTTTRLLKASKSVLVDSESSSYESYIESISLHHLKIVNAIIKNGEILKKVIADIQHELELLRSFLEAIKIIGELSPASVDRIVSTGEKLSAIVVTAVLLDQGIPAERVDLDRIIAKKDHGPLHASFYDAIALKMAKKIQPLLLVGKVVVVTGYFGQFPGSLLESVGRGYSDLTAGMVSVGLKAKELQIWKEVDGVFSADPHLVPQAKCLKTIGPDEAGELTYYGSQVLHPFTIDLLIRHGILIRIRNAFNSSNDGTLITPSLTSLAQKKAIAVTLKENILILNLQSSQQRSESHDDFLSHIFSILSEHKIKVDIISTSMVQLSLAMSQSQKTQLDLAIPKLSLFSKVSVKTDMTVVSLIGQNMHRAIGIAARMFSVLAHANVNIEMISQGASEINISCVVNGADGALSLQLIHKELLQEEDQK